MVLKEHGGRFAESQVKFYIAQIMLGLSELHEKKVVHRDIKLQNTMLTSDGYIKIIDFGLSTPLYDDEMATAFAGTPFYQAPEQHESRAYNHMVDFYAVGILTY